MTSDGARGGDTHEDSTTRRDEGPGDEGRGAGASERRGSDSAPDRRRTHDGQGPASRPSSGFPRVVIVTASVLVTAVLCIAYLVGDSLDVLPGPLTLAGLDRSLPSASRKARAASDLAGRLDESRDVDATSASRLVSSFAASSGIGADYSVAVADADGTVVAERSADQAREPASTLKTLTSLAAATTLDMGSTLDTRTYLSQSEGSGTTVILKGNGDMLLSSGDSDTSHVNGRAGLRTLAKETAQALRQRGLDTVRLVYDDSLFGSVRSPSSIATNNPDGLYYTPVSSMAVDGGREWSSGQKPSDPDDFEAYPTLSTTTAADAAAAFATRLREQGITVTGSPTSGTVPDGLSPVASVSSATLGEVMAFMLRHSDNTLAEEFGRLTALKLGTGNSPQGATAAVKQRLTALRVTTKGLSMADCSGLSPGSRVTVRTLVAVQATILRTPAASAAGEGLSVAGLVGTAKSRFDSSVAGLIHAKTGSLSGVTSMTGTVLRSGGGILVFAVIVNDPQDYSAAYAAIGDFVGSLVKL
ncbi:D-alanyl-D-alanine carboxypeptidase [uncultured Bifidobacterium sp.]|uniref:D-alanyl-D-alanine carboxypeptidase/D-alanyl-D-alanine-endopeptidase n=1 Tax=uncultured Bifidobacterium sp. TaxID=165187 RepID=UPI0028DD3476|nr:D-alanyl-D-alanine carboxypeptidase [uncultured Bifidobacterium sp.]